MTEVIIPFLVASVLLTISPGPDIIYVMVQSMANGKYAGLATTLGLVSGILVHTSLVAFGASALIRESEVLFIAIKVLGALYLFFLAYKVLRSRPEISLETKPSLVRRSRSLFKQGFVMNILNPKVTIFFLAFFPGFLWDLQNNTIFQFYILGGVFMLQALLIFGTVALLAGRISSFIKSHPSSGFVLKWLQILVFVGIGIFILL